MATWKDVRSIALGLPETTEVVSRGSAQWRVGGRLFVWQRPLRASDVAALGDASAEGPILGARVEHEGKKDALIDLDPEVFFTIPHFDGHAAILVVLDRIGRAELRKLITDAWRTRAPKTPKSKAASAPAARKRTRAPSAPRKR